MSESALSGIRIVDLSWVHAGPYCSMLLADSQVAAWQMVQEVEHEKAETIQMLGPVAKLSKTPAEIRRAPPTMGSDSDSILADLGYTPEQISKVREKGVI